MSETPKDVHTDSHISDPKVFGPGLWYSIHTTSINLNEDCFIDYIKVTVANIPCMTCRKHATEYLKDNPVLDFKGIKNDIGELIGMFKWTWTFHNAVNKRLGKSQMDWNTAYNMYTNTDALCSLSCGN